MNGLGALSPYLVLIAAGFLPNEVWRMLGIVVAHGLDEGSQLVIWVRAVATGLLAGVVAKIVLFPPGGLADVGLTVRLAAIAIGFAAFLLMRRSVLAGVLVGEAVLILGAFWLAG
jgi:Branched-chain amino acid transport protein (AzlD)